MGINHGRHGKERKGKELDSILRWNAGAKEKDRSLARKRRK